MAGYTRELKAILKRAGCEKRRQGKGDSWNLVQSNFRGLFPVDSDIRSRHTANIVFKQAGLPKAF